MSRMPPLTLILTLLCAAQFMLILDVAIVNVALPSIQRELAILPPDLQWVGTAYTVTFGGLLVLFGRAGDLLGKRRLFTPGCWSSRSPRRCVAERRSAGSCSSRGGFRAWEPPPSRQRRWPS